MLPEKKEKIKEKPVLHPYYSSKKQYGLARYEAIYDKYAKQRLV